MNQKPEGNWIVMGLGILIIIVGNLIIYQGWKMYESGAQMN